MTELCDLALKYGTDKCPQIKHHFTEFYHDMFKDRRNQIKKVVEIGIGCLPPAYTIGASLLMWRDYFPNAEIFGADNNSDLMFADNRITTIYCDQTKKQDLYHLISLVGENVDLFVDDGLHTFESQIFTCLTIMPLLTPAATYVIEDVDHHGIIVEQIQQQGYTTFVWRRSRIHYRDDRLVIVRYP